MRYLANTETTCLAHAINLCEVFYDFTRAADRAIAQQAINDLYADGVLCRNDMDADFWQTAGLLKAEYRRISLADCFAVTLAQRENAPLVTTDHHELHPLAEQKVAIFDFIR